MSTIGGGAAYADASHFIHGAVHLSLRSSTPSYAGYKVAFTADNMPASRHGSGHHSSPSFKADFHLPLQTSDKATSAGGYGPGGSPVSRTMLFERLRGSVSEIYDPRGVLNFRYYMNANAQGLNE